MGSNLRVKRELREELSDMTLDELEAIDLEAYIDEYHPSESPARFGKVLQAVIDELLGERREHAQLVERSAAEICTIIERLQENADDPEAAYERVLELVNDRCPRPS